MIIWEGELGDNCFLIYVEFYWEVCKFVNVFKGFGVEIGDVVLIYMFMILELVIVMLVCV